MNFGYLIVVAEHDEINYAKNAYALALSIKNTQKQGYDRVALVIDNSELLEDLDSLWVFDEIVEWKQETFWDGRSWMDKLSPFEYTVCLDADMLFMEDYSHWIDYFIENTELYIANTAYTYRGNLVTSDYYRKCFTMNNLPNLYSFYTFFVKNSELATEFFNLGRSIIKNPKEYSNLFLSKYKPKVLGTDEAFALAAKILDITDVIAYPLDFPRIVHMKGHAQGFLSPVEQVSHKVGFYLNTFGNLKIGNYEQTDIVHYVEKDLMDEDNIRLLEEIAWKIN